MFTHKELHYQTDYKHKKIVLKPLRSENTADKIKSIKYPCDHTGSRHYRLNPQQKNKTQPLNWMLLWLYTYKNVFVKALCFT